MNLKLNLKLNDKLSCKTGKDGWLIDPKRISEYTDITDLNGSVIGICDNSHDIFYMIPIDKNLKVLNSNVLDHELIDNLKKFNCQWLTDIESYYTKKVVWVPSEKVFITAVKYEGSTCTKCNDFARMAEPNQDDGTFMCYSCRTYRKYN